jgi:hypothetical protein
MRMKMKMKMKKNYKKFYLMNNISRIRYIKIIKIFKKYNNIFGKKKNLNNQILSGKKAKRKLKMEYKKIFLSNKRNFKAFYKKSMKKKWVWIK